MTSSSLHLERQSRRGVRLTGLLVTAALAAGASGCSSGSSGAAGNGQNGSGTAASGKTVTVTYPVIAPIRLPDLSVLNSGGTVMSGELSTLSKAEGTGMDVVSPSCDAKGDPTAGDPDVFKLTEVQNYMSTDGDSHVTLTTDRNGTKHYRDLGGDNHLEVVVHKDGSGEISDIGGDRHLTVTVNKDGSGKLEDLGGDRHLTIVVHADGSGTLEDLGGDSHLSIQVAADGTGKLEDLGGDRHLSIVIGAGGAATLQDLGGDSHLSIQVAADGTGNLEDLGGDRHAALTRKPDGSVGFSDLGGDKHLEVTVNADGSGHYDDTTAGIEFDFGTDGRATDGSGYQVKLPQAPVFSAPDRFPPLGKLGRLRPPCATVLRFAADVLFDFDKATLKPEAMPVVAKTAAFLIKTGKPIEVDGHTDAKGSDAYNDDLSLRRAEAFAAALKQQGVTVTITTKGFGEKRPVAANTTPDGKDNPSGRAQNRRVEVVLKN